MLYNIVASQFTLFCLSLGSMIGLDGTVVLLLAAALLELCIADDAVRGHEGRAVRAGLVRAGRQDGRGRPALAAAGPGQLAEEVVRALVLGPVPRLHRHPAHLGRLLPEARLGPPLAVHAAGGGPEDGGEAVRHHAALLAVRAGATQAGVGVTVGNCGESPFFQPCLVLFYHIYNIILLKLHVVLLLARGRGPDVKLEQVVLIMIVGFVIKALTLILGVKIWF